VSLLQLKEATIRFGGLIAVNKVSFSLQEGDLFGLIGPNGAGKTTCFNLITGVYEPTSGEVLYKDRSIAGLPANRIAELGICRTFQNIRLFAALSCLENVMVGAYLRHRTVLASALFDMPSAIHETQELKQESLELLKIMDLDDVANVRGVDLPYGKQRRF
jgi:branched-chain amino acid transport system ATP-binding protein